MNALRRYLDQNGELRKRSVHLLYLIFLVLIFSFIPSHEQLTNQIDSEDYLSLSKDHLLQSTQTNILFLHLIQDERSLFSDIKFRCLEAERRVNQSTEIIKDFQSGDNGQALSKADAEKLFVSIDRTKKALDELSQFKISEKLESLLGNANFVQSEDGKYFEKFQFFFKGKNGDELNTALQRLEASLNQALAYSLDQFIKNSTAEHRSQEILERIRIDNKENWKSLMETKSISSFFQSINPELENRASWVKKSASFGIQAFQADLIEKGQLISYKIQSSNPNLDRVLVKIASGDKQEYYSVPVEENFYFLPKKSGKLRIEFSYKDEVYRELVQVVEPNHSSTVGKQIILKGIPQFFSLSSDIIQTTLPLKFECDNGQVKQTSKGYSIQANRVGDVKLNIYLMASYGELLIEERSFSVIEPSLPQLTFAEYGSSISTEELQSISKVQLTAPSSDQLVFQIVSFRISAFSPLGGNNSRSIVNRGSKLSKAALSLINNAKKGQILLLDEIKLSANGKLYNAPPQSFNLF